MFPETILVEKVINVDYDSVKRVMQDTAGKEIVKELFFCIIEIRGGMSFRHTRDLGTELEASMMADKVYTHVISNQQPVNMDFWKPYSRFPSSPAMDDFIQQQHVLAKTA